MDEADLVWNRAAMDGGGSAPQEGDVALAAALRIVNLAGNGGLLHAVECHGVEDLAQGIAGFRYFGLYDAATVVEWARDQRAALRDDDDVEAVERLELEADRRYFEAVRDGDLLEEAFRRRFTEDRSRFAAM